MIEWKVTEEAAGMRLMNFVREKLGGTISGKVVKRAIESNRCEVNGVVERHGSVTLAKGTKGRFFDEGLADVAPKKKAAFVVEPTRVLFNDDTLLVYNKPEGIPCDEQGLFPVLKEAYPNLQMVHRLDASTSGVIIYAKGGKNRLMLEEMFRERKLRKEYLAVVDGVPVKPNGVCENTLGPIWREGDRQMWGEMPPPIGKQAITAWKTDRPGKEAALMHLVPETGRTHQIRIHLADMGHPILGDDRYGRHFTCSYRPARTLLHASLLKFVHPVTNVMTTVKAPLPEDFKTALVTLGL